MVVARKPLPYPTSPAAPPAQPRRRDSWEDYSDDDEPVEPPSNPYSEPATQQTYAPYRPGAGDGPNLKDGNTLSSETPRQAGEAGKLDQVPDALRPGGARLQTNPFLRKKVPQDPNIPPAEPLSKLNLDETSTNPWHPVVKTQATGSSNYDTPPATVTSETNPWNSVPVSRSYSPASEAVLNESSNDATQATFIQSPTQMGSDSNPWGPVPTNASQPPVQPPSAAVPTDTDPGPSAAQGNFMRQPPSPAPPGQQTSPLAPAPPAPQAPPAPAPPAPPEIPADSDAPTVTAAAATPEPPATAAPAMRPSLRSLGGVDTNPWVSQNGGLASPQPPISQSQSPALLSVSSDDWSSHSKDGNSKAPELLPVAAVPLASTSDQNNVQDNLEGLDKQDKGKAKAADEQSNETSQTDGWKLVDVEESVSSGGKPTNGHQQEEQRPTLPPRPDGEKPTPPPRPPGENSRWVSPRPPVDGKTETYQVKKIRWHDPAAARNPRSSPILVQNANGPCPLVALVNALSLTTPTTDVDDSSLVEVLRSREQISLNLLLDAVFEELMSPHRTGSDAALPDVSDLYAFLQSLHTGMNVNPRFIPTSAIRDAYERTSLTHLDASERAELIPGTFENTHEMSLYATFRIPLIHGWLPPTNDPAYGALERQAQTYEDAQNLLFREEELEQKLSNTQEGLDREEQQLYQDVVTIKGFLETSATQLTSWGIRVIAKAMRAGSFAILFRNDHFSTLYCHPQTGELVTLVTDDGYRSHDEVVWESLVDINGERTQYLSGDFRVVGAGASTTFSGFSDENGGGEWTTVQNDRRGRARGQAEEPAALSPREQEDRDLALALQLQEEEDQRHREQENRRQREQNLSSQYIEQQVRNPRGSISSGARGPGTSSIAPARRSSNSLNVPVTGSQRGPSGSSSSRVPTQAQQVRPLVPPRRRGANSNRPEDGGGDAPPPPYEEATHDAPFEPPAGHPNHAGSSSNLTQQPSNASTNSARPPRQVQRPAGQSAAGLRPAGASHGPARGRDRDCVVM